MGEFILGGYDRAVPESVELRTTCSPKDLSHVKYAEVHEASLLGIIYLCSLKFIQFSMCLQSW